MLAAAVKTPELELDKEEGKLLAENIAAVNAHYGKVIDPKVMAWTGLIMACGKVYAPRAVAIKMRLSMEKEARKSAPRNNVVQMAAPAPASSQQNGTFSSAKFDPSVNPLF